MIVDRRVVVTNNNLKTFGYKGLAKYFSFGQYTVLLDDYDSGTPWRTFTYNKDSVQFIDGDELNKKFVAYVTAKSDYDKDQVCAIYGETKEEIKEKLKSVIWALQNQKKTCYVSFCKAPKRVSVSNELYFDN